MEQLSLFGAPESIDSGYLPQIDLIALYTYAKEQASLCWHRKFDIEIEIVETKWSRTNGMYICNLETGRKWIRMSKPVNKSRSWNDVKGTLLHELVHWHLHTSGIPHRDGDIEFAKECIRVGAPFSGSKVAQKTARKAKLLSI